MLAQLAASFPEKFDILAREPEVILYRPDEGLDYHLPPDVGERLLAPKNE